jgi:signal transduction histidine kinase
MVGNNNKFLTGGFTMKQIYKIYSSTISFICTFVMAAGVVVLSTTLMFNCATTKSADTSSRYVAESTTTSQEVNYKGDPNETKLQKLVNRAVDLAIKSQQLYEIEEQALKAAEEARQEKEQALKAAEEARQEKEQARQEKEQALKEAKKQCINVRKMLEEAKYWCDQGYSEFCKVYKEQSAGYDTDCEKKYGK